MATSTISGPLTGGTTAAPPAPTPSPDPAAGTPWPLDPTKPAPGIGPGSDPYVDPTDTAGRKDGGIPEPPVPSTFDIGPVKMHTYGLVLGTAGITAGTILSKVARANGISTAGMGKIIVPTLVATLVGARAWHVATQWQDFKDHPGDIPKVWDGGLGIYGGLAAGGLVGSLLARSAGMPVAGLLDAAAVALPFAQSIGRWGNYANQELYGKPTDLPWGLQVDPSRRPEQYADRNSFHPTFLYESLYDAGLGVGLLALSKVWKTRPPGVLFATYIAGYAAGRFMVEGLRIDQSHEWKGLRTNQWASLGIGAAAAATAVGLVVKSHLKP